MDSPLDYDHRPPATTVDGPAPAVVFLHGRGADKDDLLGLADHLPDALHVLSVRAPDRLGPGYTWYELEMPEGDLHRSQPNAEDFRRSRDALDAFVAAAVAEYDLDDVGLFGFSQGAILSLASLLESPDRYRWAVALHGYLPASHDPADYPDAADAPVFLGTGRDDSVIPPERTERAAEALREGGLGVTFRTYRSGHNIAPGELADAADWIADRLA